MKIQETDSEKIFAKHMLNKWLISRKYQEVFKFNSKKTNNPIKNWIKDVNGHFTKEETEEKDIQHRQTLKTCKFKHDEVALEIYKLAKILKVLIIPTVTTIRATESFIHCYGTVK